MRAAELLLKFPQRSVGLPRTPNGESGGEF